MLSALNVSRQTTLSPLDTQLKSCEAKEAKACHSTTGPDWSGGNEDAISSARSFLNVRAGATESKALMDGLSR